MMRAKSTRVIWRWAILLASWPIFQGGCIGDIQREMEVLFATEANPTLIHDSDIVERFGLDFLKFFIDFW